MAPLLNDTRVKILAYAIAILGICILLASALLYLFAFTSADLYAKAKDAFNAAVVPVVLPMFEALITGGLSYILGSVLFEGIALRLKATRTTAKDDVPAPDART